MANASVATVSPQVISKPSSRLIANLLIIAVIVVLIGLGLVIANAIKHLPDASIVIKPQGLNTQQYNQLSNLLGKQANTNFLQADLQSYISKLQAVEWIGQVDVRRDWQHGVIVNVVPRQPVAKFGSEKLVDANGVVFKPADSNELQTHQWMQLQGDSQNAVVMMQQIKQVSDWFLPLKLKVQEVIVTPRMAWLFRFDNGLRVLVDNDNTSEKLYRLSVMLQNQLKPQLSKIQTIDLRYKNGMAITWRPQQTDTNDIKDLNSNKSTVKTIKSNTPNHKVDAR